MRAVYIENGVVTNTAKWKDDATLPEGWAESGTAQRGWMYLNGEFTSPNHTATLLSVSEKIEEMRIKCGKVIEAGFSSEALGYLSQYRCNRDDQNTMRNASDDGGGKIWRNEDFTLHTGAQAAQVWVEAKAHILATREHYEIKVEEIQTVNYTAEQSNAVAW